jgi:Cu-Zn family superoxide dismutase
MKKLVLTFLGMFLLFVTLGCGGSPTPKAKATLVDPQGKKVGEAMLEETAKGVKITLKVENFPPGEHAFHIHEKGLCDPPDFKTAGGHFNPFGKEHGLKNPEGPHAGDLPNITIGSDGRGSFEIMAPLVTLKTGEKNSVFQPGGTSLMVHQGPDDNVSDPAGHAGPRIACGLIVKQ